VLLFLFCVVGQLLLCCCCCLLVLFVVCCCCVAVVCSCCLLLFVVVVCCYVEGLQSDLSPYTKFVIVVSFLLQTLVLGVESMTARF